jgi:hypothetical protein
MKIALLNLPLDNNYGGNLQRYALVTTLEKLGHQVTFLQCESVVHKEPEYKLIPRYVKRILKKILFNRDTEIFAERNRYEQTLKNNQTAVQFVHKHLTCSESLHNKEELTRYVQSGNFDAVVVGSDQVWRKRIAHEYGLSTYFLDFLGENQSIKRVAFAASLGTDVNELSSDEISELGKFYSRFDAVSIREQSGIALLESYGWNEPRPEQLLDPTFMLAKEDYVSLIRSGETLPSEGKMFCYILDKSAEKADVIAEESEKRGLKPYYASIADSTEFSIYQWLRSFEDAGFVVTDSFHGVVFSIIFNKPFRLIRNPFRGNARFESLFDVLGISGNTDNLDWDKINANIECQRKKSIHFLETALNKKVEK